MAERKTTKREIINMMLADEVIASNEMFVSYLRNELELLNKKAEKKATSKNAEENEKYKVVILAVLSSADKAMTVTEIQKSNAELGELSNQRVSAILKKMVEDDKTVTKTTESRKTVFRIAEQGEGL